jgi:hypothetical protein
MAYKPAAEPLDQFIKRKGGRLNAWAFLFDDASLQNMSERCEFSLNQTFIARDI